MKILTVFGATGNQGGSVIRAVLAHPVLSREFTIRGITRNVNKPAAQALAAQGVEVVSADMSSPESAAPAVKDAHTVFLVTNFWESMSMQTEIATGKAVTDASKAAGVSHIVFSSLLDVTRATDGRLPNVSHFDGKAEIERYIRSSGVPATFFLPGFYMDNFVGAIARDGQGYTLAVPVDPERGRPPLIDASSDTGKFVIAALQHPPAGHRILGATDYYSFDRIAREFSEVIGKPAKAVRIPEEEWKAKLPAPVAQEMLENYQLLEQPGYYRGESLAASLALLEQKPTSWKEYVERNKEKWLK